VSQEMTLKNGTKLVIRGVPALLILAVSEKYPVPEVPMWRNEEKQRDEPNPLDPEYTKAVAAHKKLIEDKTIDCFLANGVTVTEIGPDCLPVDSDEWLENVEYTLDIELPHKGTGRRVAWLRHHLLDDAGELGDIITAITVATGLVSEEAVQQAAKTFRDNQDGAADTGLQTTSDSGLGDQTGDPSRASEPVRVQGDSQIQSDPLVDLADFR